MNGRSRTLEAEMSYIERCEADGLGCWLDTAIPETLARLDRGLGHIEDVPGRIFAEEEPDWVATAVESADHFAIGGRW